MRRQRLRGRIGESVEILLISSLRMCIACMKGYVLLRGFHACRCNVHPGRACIRTKYGGGAYVSSGEVAEKKAFQR